MKNYSNGVEVYINFELVITVCRITINILKKSKGEQSKGNRKRIKSERNIGASIDIIQFCSEYLRFLLMIIATK